MDPTQASLTSSGLMEQDGHGCAELPCRSSQSVFQPAIPLLTSPGSSGVKLGPGPVEREGEAGASWAMEQSIERQGVAGRWSLGGSLESNGNQPLSRDQQ